MKSSRVVSGSPIEPAELPLQEPLASGIAAGPNAEKTHGHLDVYEKAAPYRADLFDLPMRPIKPGGLEGGIVSGVEALFDQLAIDGLRNDPAFKTLPPDVQAKMLAGAQASPRPLAKTFQDLANNANFRALAPSTQAIAAEQLAKHPKDTAATNAIYRLLNTRGFEQLNTDEKDRLLHLVGGTNNFISVPERQALAALTSSPAYMSADVTRKGQMLRDFLQKQTATPYLVAGNAGALPRAPFSVSEAKEAGDHGFRSGKAEAVTYDVKIGDQTIKVTLPKNPPAGSNLPTIDEIAKSLAALPPASRALVKEVVINPGQNPDDAYWEKKYGTPGFRSYMTAGKEGVVNIYPTTSAQSQTFLENSMIHETGHVLSKTNWGDDLNDPRWQPWKDAVAKDGIVPSGYGKNSLNEDFAETLVIYMNVRGTPAEAEMRALMPERFKLIDQLLK